MISNSIINQANKFVSGEQIFGFLVNEEANKATDMLKTVLDVCGSFKQTYFSFRDMAERECPQHPWAVQPAAAFIRLNQTSAVVGALFAVAHHFSVRR